MATNLTEYHVRTVYETVDKSSGVLDSVRKDAERASKATSTLARDLGLMKSAFIGYQVFGRAKKSLIDFNDTLEQSKITMGGMLRLNLGGTFAEQFDRANTLVSEFQQIAKASVGTTADFVSMAQMITRPVTAAKLGMGDLRDITKGAVIAAKAFGIQAEVAALDIEQALSGQLTSKERFARALLEPMGITREAFNKLQAKERAGMLKSALTQPAINEMAQAQEKSFSGVMSTFEDNLQMTLGKVGKPLFEQISREVKSWNKWIDANGTRIEAFADKLSTSLVDAFSFIKDVSQFFVENSNTLLAIAKGLVAYKAGKVLTGLGANAFGHLRTMGEFWKRLLAGGNSLREITGSATAAQSALGALAGGVGALTPILAGLAGAGSALWSMWDARREKERKQRELILLTTSKSVELAEKRRTALATLAQTPRTARDRLDQAEARRTLDLTGNAQMARDRALVRLFKDQGAFDRHLKVRSEWLNQRTHKLLETGDLALDKNFLLKAANRMDKLGARRIIELLEPEKKRDGVDFEAIRRETEEKFRNSLARTNIKVVINKIEVASNDPDRFIHGIAKAVEKLNRNPRQAVAALRGGF
ncbi:MAG: hypothetical protein MJE77_37845 [Proteobacteria bacterium]|nr:hypothetical protein [Pseudomonadota bacterium]